MSLPKILLCLDPDPQPSVFDSVVAVDAGVDQLFRHGGVRPEQVRDLVYGAMFTRGPEELKNTALFVGGSDVAAGQALMRQATDCFFGPMRVSVLLDANGSNTTAAAAVVAAGRHVSLDDKMTAAVMGTGPVGQRAALMLASEGVTVRVASRTSKRAAEACETLKSAVPDGIFVPIGTNELSLQQAIGESSVLIAAGPAGVQLVSEEQRSTLDTLRVVIDLNAVPPLGVGGLEVSDKAAKRENQICYGAIGVGGTKMKIHKAAIRRLFESNDSVLDAAEVYAIGKELEG